MENYYKKYKLWTLYFGAFYSGNNYYLPDIDINPLQFNKYFSPFYIDLINIPKEGYISYINFLEPLHKKFIKDGADQNHFLPERIDTLDIDFEKIRDLYPIECDQRAFIGINFFDNNLTYVPTGANVQNKTWSTPSELYNLMYNLSLTYTGNITGSPEQVTEGNNQNLIFSGIGYGLHNCYGCIEDISFVELSGIKTKEYYPNCDAPLLDLKSATFTIKYNTYNLFYNELDESETLLNLNSEKINLETGRKDYINPEASNSELLKIFTIGTTINNLNVVSATPITGITEVSTLFDGTLNKVTITGTGILGFQSGSIESLAKTKNEIPLFFRTLNFNSPTLSPCIENTYSTGEILNFSGENITSYKYIPNLKCSEKVYGSRLFNVPLYLSDRGIPVDTQLSKIYKSLISGISPYEYEVTKDNYLPSFKNRKENRAYYFSFEIASGFLIFYTNPAQSARLTGNTFGLGNPASDNFGISTSLNSAGNVLAVGAYNADTAGASAGAVYIFTGGGNSWVQTARLTGNTLGLGNPAGDNFGYSTSLNSAGNVLSVGASNADTNAVTAGAVYLFTGVGNSWAQAARLTGNTFGSGNPASDNFGWSTSLNSAGNVLSVGAYNADTNAVNFAGAVYIFTGGGNSWVQTARLTGNTFGSGNPASDFFGYSTSLSSAGNVLAVGAIAADTNAVNFAGAVYIFTGGGNSWVQTARLTGDTLGLGNPASDQFGISTSLNSLGSVLSVGAFIADTTGVNAGAVYIFTGGGNSWVQTARLTGNTFGSGNPANDNFGISTSLSSLGNVLAVGAYTADTAGASAGAVYLFTGVGNSWVQTARLTGNTFGSGNPDGDFFGYSTSLNSLGSVLSVGAYSADTNAVNDAGAVYLFTNGGIEISGESNFFQNVISQTPGDSGIKNNSIFYTDNLSLKIHLNTLDNLSFLNFNTNSYSLDFGGTYKIKNKVNFNKNYYQINSGDLIGLYMDNIFTFSGTGNSSNLPPFKFSISGKNFVLENSPILNGYKSYSPAYFTNDYDPSMTNIPMLYMQPRSTFLITGVTGGLPISIFFVESGFQFSGQKTIQSLNKSGFITTRALNTGAMIGFSGISYTSLRNPIFNNDFQIGNLLMDTGRLLYYVNNSLIYSGATGFNLEHIMLGSNNSRINGFTGIHQSVGISNESRFASGFHIQYYNNLFGFSGAIHEILIYDSFLNEDYKNKVYIYLTNKWSGIYQYAPSGLVYNYDNTIDNTKNYKINSSDYDPMINFTPKENEKHILLLEYNLYGFSGSNLDSCDIDLNAYILRTGLHEEIIKKDPFKSLFTVNFNTGLSKSSLQKIEIKQPNINNICDMNYSYRSFSNKILIDYLKEINTNALLYKPPKEQSCLPDYIKYGKIYGNKI